MKYVCTILMALLISLLINFLIVSRASKIQRTSAAEMLEGDQKALADTFGELKTYETYNIAFNDLKAGAIDAIAIDMTTGAYLVSTAS